MRDIPPHLVIPSRDSIAKQGIARFCPVSIGYRASIAEISLCCFFFVVLGNFGARGKQERDRELCADFFFFFFRIFARALFSLAVLPF